MLTTFLSRINTKRIVLQGLILNCFIFTAIVVSAYKPVTNIQADGAMQVMHWNVDGTDREAMVYIPASAKTKLTPVVFSFHGHGGTMENMYRSRGFDKLWPEAIIVCPQGLNTPGQLTDPEGKLPGWQKAPGDMNDRDLLFLMRC